MTQLTEHFTLEEMTYSQTASRYGIDNTPPPNIVEELTRTCEMLELVRTVLGGYPIMITSGYRCPELNAACGGSSTSQHMYGQAVDFYVPSYGTPKQVCDAIMAADPPIIYDQLIWEYGDWVHMSQSDDPRMMAMTINEYGTTMGIA
jgi:zinc D-Ala-D-Ala carboxypeptidase